MTHPSTPATSGSGLAHPDNGEKQVVPVPAVHVKDYSPQADVRAFHEAFLITDFVDEADAYAREKGIKMRMKLIGEEYQELIDELIDINQGDGSIFRVAKELSDLLYVVYGTAVYLDIPVQDVFDAVHVSNMSKLGPDGKPILRYDGKVMKTSPTYRSPDLAKAMGFTEAVAETS